MKNPTAIFSVLSAILILASPLSAQVPHLVNYQGSLTDTGGDPVEGDHALTFIIYPDSAQASVPIWSETHPVVSFDGGLFHVLLGSVAALPDSLFQSEIRWLGITVDPDPEISPRIRITSVPWALKASRADTAGTVLEMPVHDHNDLYYTESELNGAGTLNEPANPVDWTKLKSVPDGFADGADDVGGPDSDWNLSGDDMYSAAAGNVGIGTPTPGEKLDVVGTIQTDAFRMPTGASNGYVLTSDGTGTGTWQLIPASGDITAVNAGAGLTGGSDTGDATLDVDFAGNGAAATVARSDHGHDDSYYTESELSTPGTLNEPANPVDWTKLKSAPACFADGTDDIGGPDSDWNLSGDDMYSAPAGNVGIGTPTPGEKLDVAGAIRTDAFRMPTGASDGHVLTSDGGGAGTWQVIPASGDITAVNAGAGLTGGSDTGDATLDVDFAGNGAAATVARSDHEHDAAYVNTGEADAVTSAMITDGEITDADIAGGAAIDPAKITGTAWTGDNDGDGSGLEADILDGLHAGAFSDTAHLHDDRYYTENELDAPGTINQPANPVDWTNLKSVPAGFADGTDAVGTDNDWSISGNNIYMGLPGNVGIGLSSPIARVHALNTNGNFGYLGHSSYGAYGNHTGGGNFGILGSSQFGAYGKNVVSGSYGSVGSATNGVAGHSVIYAGIYGTSVSGMGVYGYSDNGWSGYFQGDVHVTGSLTEGGGGPLIDHPGDPENKVLRHSYVASPENLLIYRGKATLDGEGFATVPMPDYFTDLAGEEEATVNLTPIGRPFLAGYEWGAEGRSFTILGEPGRQVAWMVLAGRDDPVIRQLEAPVVEMKGPESGVCDRGEYLYPAAYGQPVREPAETVPDE